MQRLGQIYKQSDLPTISHFCYLLPFDVIMFHGVRLAQHGIRARTNQIYQRSKLALGIHVVIHSNLLARLQVTTLHGLAIYPKSSKTAHHIMLCDELRQDGLEGL